MQRHTDEHCGRFMPTCSCDFYDPAYAPLDMAAEVTAKLMARFHIVRPRRGKVPISGCLRTAS